MRVIVFGVLSRRCMVRESARGRARGERESEGETKADARQEMVGTTRRRRLDCSYVWGARLSRVAQVHPQATPVERWTGGSARVCTLYVLEFHYVWECRGETRR